MKETHTNKLSLFETLGFVWSVVSPHRRLLYGMVACACLFSLIEVLLPVIGKSMFDSIAAAGQGQADAPSADDVWHYAYVFFGFNLVFWLFRYGMFYAWIPLSAAYMRRIVEVAFARVQMFSTAWHNNTFSGVTVRNITRGMTAIDGVMNLALTQFFPSFLVIVFAAAYMVYAGHPVMGAVLVVFLLLFTLTTGFISLKVVAKLNRSANEVDSAIGGLVADAITCNPAVKSFGAEDYEYQRIHNGLDEWEKRKFKAWYAGMSNGILQTFLNVSLRAGFVFMAVYQWAHGQATIGDVFFAFSMTAIIGAYLRDFGMQLRMLQNHINDLEPVAAYMQMQPTVVDAPQAAPLAASAGAVSFEGVTFGYKTDRPPLFHGFSVDIPAGKTVALVGRSGSGKTTFVKLLQRLYDVQAGRILVDGQDIASVTQQSLHQSVALVPQDPILFHRSLAENIAYGRQDATLDTIRAAARDAFIDDFIMSLPEGYNTLVGERGVKLSGGERQRVAIARAIVANRPILIMDEATSSLDSVSESLIQCALEKLLVGRTTIVIAHRLSTIRKADLILVFDKGQVVEQGSHEALLAKGGAYKRLYDAQSGGFIL